ncbi:MAG: transposase [Thermoplasmata archaeon YP2-bin.285]|uniref:Transposase n=1 Tax=Candidatus Sysuiplasma superficiale TaxID=2823368 RepID=A0A8J8CEV5_9ARCH|nr:transposase [Candidatus Sysuiplasma superficiale]
MTTKRMIAASEKMAILNEGMQPGAVVTELCRKHNIGSSTYYKWKKEAVQGMKEAVTGPSKEVIALKQENARLKKLVAEEALLIDRLRELNETLSRGKNDGRRLSQ